MGKKNRQNKNKIVVKNLKEDAVNSVKEEVVVSEETLLDVKSKEELDKLIDIALAKFEAEKKEAEEKVTEAQTVFEKYQKDIESIADKEQEYKNLENECNSKVSEIENYKKQIEGLSNKVASAKGQIEEAKKEAEKIKKDARETAEKEADAQKIKIIEKANEEAKNAWKDAVDSVGKQLQDLREKEIALNEREKEINKKEIAISDKELAIKDQQELLEEDKKLLDGQRKKYLSCSPQVVESVKADLEEEKDKYNKLLEQYKEKREEYNKLQILIDSFNVELNNGVDNGSLSDLVRKLQELTKERDNIKKLIEKYPTIESIDEMSSKAKEYEKQKEIIENLNGELSQWKENYSKIKNKENELKALKIEVDATNALNEHLLKELESHKTALESRTGDTCPSLTKVDTECETQKTKEKISEIESRGQINKLGDIVYHVKNYAGSRRDGNELWYKDDDIRAFLSGMAVSRLIILQGMSGTGKSSLPKIFSEAISGLYNLIPVESSWRDRNELLGYYNDFNKKFNAKSFTIELYRSGKPEYQNIPSFLVLDEMNLARIEYYFSDFLSILEENDRNKWLIELVSSDMRTLPMQLDKTIKDRMKKESPNIYDIWEKIDAARRGNLGAELTEQEKTDITEYLKGLNCLVGAKDLVDGRKIRVTDNIWFVGTANNDESTFEITDKVYDRAQVITLNESGKKARQSKYDERKVMSLSARKLLNLFNEAKNEFKNAQSVESKLEEVRNIMINHFNTSFGDRIMRQAIDYVAVFTASGGTLETAIDYQLSNKVIRKIVTYDKIEAFTELLKVIDSKYPKTKEIIEKRIKELENENKY